MYIGLNRTACDVIEEIRKMNESRNFAGLLGNIEELQVMVNKMEAAIYDKGDIKGIVEEKAKLKKEMRELEKKRDDLEAVVGKLPKEKAKNVLDQIND